MPSATVAKSSAARIPAPFGPAGLPIVSQRKMTLFVVTVAGGQATARPVEPKNGPLLMLARRRTVPSQSRRNLYEPRFWTPRVLISTDAASSETTWKLGLTTTLCKVSGVAVGVPVGVAVWGLGGVSVGAAVLVGVLAGVFVGAGVLVGVLGGTGVVVGVDGGTGVAVGGAGHVAVGDGVGADSAGVGVLDGTGTGKVAVGVGGGGVIGGGIGVTVGTVGCGDGVSVSGKEAGGSSASSAGR